MKEPYGDDFYCAVCDRIREAVADAVVEAVDEDTYNKLTVSDRAATVIAGVSAAMATLLFCQVQPQSWDEMEKAAAKHLPTAFQEARKLLAGSPVYGETIQ
jgi:hypothetical protein